MTYNPNIPKPTDPFSQSQGQIKTNFAQADTLFDVNHVKFDDPTAVDRGKHRKVDMLQIAPPGVAVSQMVFYNKLVSGISNLFYQRDGSATEIQMTAANPNVATTGETFLPGGLLLKWGSTSGTGDDSVTFAGLGLSNFPNNGFVVLTQVVNAGGGPATVNQFVSVRGITTTGFSFTATRRVEKLSDTVSFYFIALGN